MNEDNTALIVIGAVGLAVAAALLWAANKKPEASTLNVNYTPAQPSSSSSSTAGDVAAILNTSVVGDLWDAVTGLFSSPDAEGDKAPSAEGSASASASVSL